MPVAVSLSLEEMLEKVSVATEERACHAEAIDKEAATRRAIPLCPGLRPSFVRKNVLAGVGKQRTLSASLPKKELSPIPRVFF